MAARDGAGVAGGAVADEVERLIPAQFGQQDAVRLHAQAGFQAHLGRELAGAPAALGVEQVHHIGLADEQFAGILDGDQPLLGRNVVHQRFHECGLAAAGGAGDHDVLAVPHGLPEKGGVIAAIAQLQQLGIVGARRLPAGCHRAEKALVGILLQAARIPGGQPDRDGDGAGLDGGRHHELRTLPGRKGQRHHGFCRRDALPGMAFVHHRGTELPRPLVAQPFDRQPLPAAARFQIHPAGTVDADFRHVGAVQQFGNAQHLVLVLQKAVGNPVRRQCWRAVERRAHGCSTPAKSISREA